MLQILFICVLAWVAGCKGGAATSFIKPCAVNDQSCMLSSAQAAIPHVAAGIPELGVPPMDPLIIDEIHSEEEGLILNFKNMKVVGASRCQMTSVNMSPDFKKLDFVLECPFTCTGQYSVGGKLKFISVEGNGDCEVVIKKLQLSVQTEMETITGADGKEYLNIVKFDYQYDPLEQVYYKFDNLYNGDEEKAKSILVILNDRWKEVLLTIAKPIVDKVAHTMKDNTNKLTNGVPKYEFVLNKSTFT